MRKQWKKWTAPVLCAAMLFSTAACGAKEGPKEPEKEHSSQQGSEWNETQDLSGEQNDFFENQDNENHGDENYGGDSYGGEDNQGDDRNDGAYSVKRAHAFWEGFYTDDDYYGGNWGYARIYINEKGLIDVTFQSKEGSGHYVMEESEYSKRDDEGLETGFAWDDENGSISSIAYDGYSLSINALDNETSEWVQVPALRKKVQPDRTLPAGYEDKDRFGAFTENGLDDTGLFTPVTEDYMVLCESSTYYIYDRTTWETKNRIPYQCFTLYSFDENGCCVDGKQKFVFADETEAQQVYEYENSIRMDQASRTILGSVLYYGCWDQPTYSSKAKKLSSSRMKLYYGCHYIYQEENDLQNQSLENFRYAWISKPFEKYDYLENNIGGMTEDIAVICIPWLGAYYHCTENGCSRQIWFNGYIPDDFNLEPLDRHHALRVYADHTIGVTYGEFFSNNANEDTSVSFNNAVAFTEYEYTQTSLKTTAYVFELENEDYQNCGVTFENFRSKVCSYTETHTYDMTKPEK